MTTPEGTPETMANPQWVTIAEVAEMLGQSEKTVRRKIKAGELVAEKRHDPDIGGGRWYVDAAQLPRQPGTVAALVPVEIFERLDTLYREIAEVTARADKAETVAEFERERRKALEDEKQAATDATEALRAELEAERARRWWQRR